MPPSSISHQHQMACRSTMEKDQYFLSSKDPPKTNEDRSSDNNNDDDDDRGPALKKRRRSSMSGSKEKNNIVSKNNKKKMKDEFSASSCRSSMTRRTLSVPLVPPASNGGGFRRVSFLERSLFPGINKPDLVLPTPPWSSSTTEQSKTAQLTIFYAGVINVYDDVPVDQAQAVMLLASQRSSSHPVIKDITKADQVVKSVPRSLTPSLCKTQQDLPIARRLSLQRFLDKRRERIISKYPCEVANDKG